MILIFNFQDIRQYIKKNSNFICVRKYNLFSEKISTFRNKNSIFLISYLITKKEKISSIFYLNKDNLIFFICRVYKNKICFKNIYLFKIKLSETFPLNSNLI